MLSLCVMTDVFFGRDWKTGSDPGDIRLFSL